MRNDMSEKPAKPIGRYDMKDLQEALKVLKEGGIILYPTDTVWGLGCDARSKEAVERIYRLKQRSDSKSMLVLVGNEGMLQRSVKDVPEIAWQLIDVAVNPLTLIYEGAHGVADNLIAEDGSLGIRITSEPFSKALTERLGAPIVSTSANISGKPTPRFFSEIDPDIIAGVDYVCRFRRDDNTPTQASNIIKITQGNVIKVIR